MIRDKEHRIEAFTRLGLATRERLDKETQLVYLEDTALYATAVLQEACRRLERSAAWFPKVKELRDACDVVAKEHQIRYEATHPRLTAPPEPSQERVQMWLRRLKAVSQGRKPDGFVSTREAFDPKAADAGRNDE